MKLYTKIYLLTLCLLGWGFTANSQVFHAGIIGGLGGSQISGDNLSGFDKLSFMAGGYVGAPLSEKFDFTGQLVFITKGSKKNQQPEKNDYTSYLLRLQYIEMPLLLKWKYSKRFHFEIGPTVGYLLSSYEEDEYGQDPVSRPFKSFELGIAGGMIVNIKNGFAFNARLESSVLPVRDHASQASYRLNHGQYNAVLMFSFQYTFKSGAHNEQQ